MDYLIFNTNQYIMKKGFFILFILCLIPSLSFAASDVDSDYTLIDCIAWDDSTGVSFDSTQPYQTLKEGIEKSIEYINTNINTVWNEVTASGKTFSVKVKCSANNLVDTTINLDFKWVYYNNQLVIEGIEDNGLVIQNTKFYQAYQSGNITFKNAKFIDAPGYYFYDQMFTSSSNLVTPVSFGIKIINSYIQLNNATQLWSKWTYILKYSAHYPGYYKMYNRPQYYVDYYYYYYHTTNQQNIQNSVIEIELDADYDFKMPVYLKDSKVTFKNKAFWQNYTINFLEEWNANNSAKLNYSALVSNEINLWGNSFATENDEDIAFINNKISNFSSFTPSAKPIYFNNTIENTSDVSISTSLHMYNNSFSGSIIDTYDTSNVRHNYQNGETGSKGIAWIFRRNNALKYFNINITSIDIFKEVTWIDIPNIYNAVFVIFKK